jgi:hypothetical protein
VIGREKAFILTRWPRWKREQNASGLDRAVRQPSKWRTRLPSYSRHRCGIIRHMIGLTDNQLRTVMDMAHGAGRKAGRLFAEDRRNAGIGQGRFNDADVADVAQLALTGLAHQPAA